MYTLCIMCFALLIKYVGMKEFFASHMQKYKAITFFYTNNYGVCEETKKKLIANPVQDYKRRDK